MASKRARLPHCVIAPKPWGQISAPPRRLARIREERKIIGFAFSNYRRVSEHERTKGKKSLPDVHVMRF